MIKFSVENLDQVFFTENIVIHQVYYIKCCDSSSFPKRILRLIRFNAENIVIDQFFDRKYCD